MNVSDITLQDLALLPFNPVHLAQMHELDWSWFASRGAASLRLYDRMDPDFYTGELRDVLTYDMAELVSALARPGHTVPATACKSICDISIDELRYLYRLGLIELTYIEYPEERVAHIQATGKGLNLGHELGPTK